MAKKPIKKQKIDEADQVTIPVPSNFDLQTFFKSVDKLTLENGFDLLRKKTRVAIQNEEKTVEINSYAMMALLTTWQSLMQDFIVVYSDYEEVNRVKAREAIMRSVSITGIREKIADEKYQREYEKQQKKYKR